MENGGKREVQPENLLRAFRARLSVKLIKTTDAINERLDLYAKYEIHLVICKLGSEYIFEL